MKRLVLLLLAFVACNGYAQSTPSFSGLWWTAAEAGWGLNVTHQGDVLFATWFTYDRNGNGQWLVMPHGDLMAMDSGEMGMMMNPGMMGMMPGMMMGTPTFGGMLYRTTGPAFDAKSFDPSAVTTTVAGYAMLTFQDDFDALFEATVDGVYQSKWITRETYSTPPVCGFGMAPDTSNFQDLWWRAGGTESGWGLNVTQQGGVVFATWFTYDESGKGLWLVMPDATQSAPMTYTGKLYRTRGPSFDATPWNPANVVATEVGSATLAFSDPSNGTFTAQVGTSTIVKPIARQTYASPASVCR
jgi:hypothetical protein